MSLVSFVFSQEQLEATKTSTEGQRTLDGVAVGQPGERAAVGGYLSGGRAPIWFEELTDTPQAGTEWVPDPDHSVVYTEADTWACFCCGAWTWCGCMKSVARLGVRFYRQTRTRAWWIHRFNGLCLLVHVFMACLSATACGARWPSNNENCTATDMTVHIYRLRAVRSLSTERRSCSLTPSSPHVRRTGPAARPPATR